MRGTGSVCKKNIAPNGEIGYTDIEKSISEKRWAYIA